MVTAVLFLFDGLRLPLGLMGVDYAQFRAILEVKFTQDTRREIAGFHRRPAAGRATRCS